MRIDLMSAQLNALAAQHSDDYILINPPIDIDGLNPKSF